jgi:peptidoglycan/LPS O-acetylase OafA/YrhL
LAGAKLTAKAISIAERLDATKGRPTGFDYLRIILALGVIVAHAFPLSYGIQYAYQLERTPLGGFQAWIVPMFFALSGFLVAGSLERNPIGVFVGLRVIRIAPALAVEVTLSALLLGPLLTTVPLAHYFADPKFRSYFLKCWETSTISCRGYSTAIPIPTSSMASCGPCPSNCGAISR